MGNPGSANGLHVRRIALAATALTTLAALVIDVFVIPGESTTAFLRGATYLTIIGITIWQLRLDLRIDIVAMWIGGAFGTLAIVDLARGTQTSLIDPITTLTVLVLLAAITIATAPGYSRWWVAAISTFIFVYTIGVALLADLSPTNTIGLILVGGIGQALVIWVLFQLIEQFVATSRRSRRHARIEAALSRCSEALLARQVDDPLIAAIEALLGATEADYAYIDVNRTNTQGNRTWEIVADAYTDDYPGQASEFVSGDYAQLEFVEKDLQRGEAATVITAELPMPIRAEYEAEGIKAELIAPIIIGDRWLGSLGYIDHRRLGTWTDIEVDGLKRAAEMIGAYWEREAAREGLMELAKAKDRFIASVSHELRTPLSAVVGFASELVDGVSGLSKEELAEMASLIYEQSLEVSFLVDDLLTAERAASGNLTVRPTTIQLLDECYDIVSTMQTDKQIDIVGEPVQALADGLRTRQVVRNLITNAERHGGDRIEVEISAEDDFSRIVVRDNGKGADVPDADRIFDPYYRSQGAETTPDSVGLGLAVARQLARLMAGELTYTRAGGWTIFELTLPLAGTKQPVPVLDPLLQTQFGIS